MRRAAPALRRPRWLLAVGALLALGTSLAYAVVDLRPEPGQRPDAQAKWLGAASPLDDVEAVADTDRDGLPDLMENYVWGSDPNHWSTTRSGIPDGWLTRYGYDPTRLGWERTPMAVPEDLPLRLAAGDASAYTSTLAKAYAYGRPMTWNESRDGGWDSGIDPRRATTPDGIAVAWLLRQGLDPRDSEVGSRRLDGDDETVRENYLQGTNPRLADTDDDGLSDGDEVRRYRTDPTRASTTGSGIPDGWLVRWNFDPLDESLSHRSFNGKGMTLLDVYQYNELRFGRAAALQGAGLDPRARSHTGGPIPDGWLVEHGYDPLVGGVESHVLQRASQYAEFNAAAEGRPDVVLTLRDAYLHNRPNTWKEQDQGPWRGGLDPRDPDPDDDGLPDVVELRGWFINVTVGFGASRLTTPMLVTSDPLRDDTDGDGLTDGQEFWGRVQVGSLQRYFAPSDPSRRDTAFSGLSDGEKVLGLTRGEFSLLLVERDPAGRERVRLEPNRSDADGDGLRDGEELESWLAAAGADPLRYQDRFPHSGESSVLDWFGRLPQVRAKGLPVTESSMRAALMPDGDADLDGVPNILDSDSDGDGLLDGWEVRPELLAFSDFASPFPRAPTDPANPDTDGDQLPDGWELRFGSFVPASGRWTLDPSRFRSDGQTPDGEANLDADEIVWYAHDLVGGRPVPKRQTFAFNNLAEFQAGTDPRVADQNGDGLVEAWPFFWGTLYPALVAGGGRSANLDVGDLTPDSERIAALAPQLSVSDPSLGGRSKLAEGEPYWRFEVGANPPLDVARGERVIRTDSVQAFGGVHVVSTIQGQAVLTFREEAALGTNPYLLDTDGDGLPDAWEALWGTCFLPSGDRSPNPVVPDAAADPDQDGRTNRQEYEEQRNVGAFGTNPCGADTDLGGIDDGHERFLGLNPLRPSDDAISGEASSADTDGDGVRDVDEILRGTDPASVDTDRDGLLDGFNIALEAPLEGDPPAAVRALLERGIARSRQVTSNGILYVFKGEASLGTNPADPDTAGDGIPDGWKAAYGLPAAQAFPQHAVRYSAGRPSWWDEPVHGVWWWGLPPTSSSGVNARDLDLDGLDDLNGEDPVPAARHSCCLRLPHPLDAPSSEQAWLFAQAYGENPGDPSEARRGWQAADWDNDGIPDAADRAPTVTFLESVEQPPGTPLALDAPLQKGDAHPFRVRGRVVVDCAAFGCAASPALANRPVGVFLEGLGFTEPLGLGVTDADGVFDVLACVCTVHEHVIPLPGIVLRGQTEGIVRWSFPASDVSVGGRTIVARAFNTTATFWDDPERDTQHPQHQPLAGVVAGLSTVAHSTAGSVSPGHGLLLVSPTVIELSVADEVLWTGQARQLPVEARLRDVTGRPLAGFAVRVTGFGQSLTTPPTDARGSAQAVLHLSASLSGESGVHARYDGFAPLLHSSLADAGPIRVQGPSTLKLGAPPSPAASGSTLLVAGTLSQSGFPLTDAAVSLRLEATGATLASPTAAVTDEQGLFHASLRIPDAARGPILLRAAYAGSPLHAPSADEASLEALGGVRLELEDPPRALSTGQKLVVQGRVADTQGAPLGGHRVELVLAGRVLADASSDAGRFRLEAVVGPEFEPGLWSLQVAHPLQEGHAEARVGFDLFLSQRTTLRLDAGRASHGAMAPVSGRLLDARGQPLAGQVVELYWAGRPVGTAYTGLGGRLEGSWRPPDGAGHGPGLLEARFLGSEDGRFGPNATRAVWILLDGTVLSWRTDGPEPRDAVLLGGALKTRAARPVPDAPIAAYVGDFVLGRTTTLSDGDWVMRVSLPADLPAGLVRFRVEYPGNETLAATQLEATLPVRASAQLTAVVDPVLPIGQEVAVQVEVRETGGPEIPSARLAWSLAGSTDNATVMGAPGRLLVHSPADALPGAYALRIEYAGDTYRLPASLEVPVTLRMPARIEIVEAPTPLRSGETAHLRVRLLDDQARPLSHERLALLVDGWKSPLFTSTDADGYAAFPLLVAGSGSLEYTIRYAGSQALAPATHVQSLYVEKALVVEPSHAVLATLLVGAAILILAAGYTWIRLRPLARVRQALWDAAQELVAGDDTSASILLAYEKLSQAFRRYGYDERASETASEFLVGLRDFFPTDPRALEDLARLFDRARYGTQPMNPPDRDVALDALRVLLGDLDRFVEGLRSPKGAREDTS